MGPDLPRDLLDAVERALAHGDPEAARALLARVDEAGLGDESLPRFAAAMVQINRFLSRQRETVAWIERRLAGPCSAAARATLLRARVNATRQYSARGVLELAEEALAAALAVGDLEAWASVLADAAFAAYRRADARAADRFAQLAAGRDLPGLAGIHALRAQMFAAIARGALEAALDTSLEVRRRRLALGDLASAANECNNIAENLLELGLPGRAKQEATRGADLAAQAGHRGVERYARVLVAVATAEEGAVDQGIALLRGAGIDSGNVILASDTAAWLAFWLVERGQGGDALDARAIVAAAVARASAGGLVHRLTTLLATLARACHRLGDGDAARDALERARTAADTADHVSEAHLALTMAEVLPAHDPARAVALSAARARLLRAAGRRADPGAYCTAARLNRRLLELSGGVPADLPQGA